MTVSSIPAPITAIVAVGMAVAGTLVSAAVGVASLAVGLALAVLHLDVAGGLIEECLDLVDCGHGVASSSFDKCFEFENVACSHGKGRCGCSELVALYWVQLF